MRRKTVAITASAAVVTGLAVWGAAAWADDDSQYQWDGGPEVSASPIPSHEEGGQGAQYQWDGGPEVSTSPSPEPSHVHDDSHSHDEAAPHDHDMPTGAVDGWSITVTEVQLDANATIAADASNAPPQHQYVLVTVVGVNVSHDPLDLTLSAQLRGSDQKVYEESANVTTPYDISKPLVTTAPGGTSAVQYVFDVPPAALGKGTALLLGYDGEPFVIVP